MSSTCCVNRSVDLQSPRTVVYSAIPLHSSASSVQCFLETVNSASNIVPVPCVEDHEGHVLWQLCEDQQRGEEEDEGSARWGFFWQIQAGCCCGLPLIALWILFLNSKFQCGNKYKNHPGWRHEEKDCHGCSRQLGKLLQPAVPSEGEQQEQSHGPAWKPTFTSIRFPHMIKCWIWKHLHILTYIQPI